jgi:hypothetical protein
MTDTETTYPVIMTSEGPQVTPPTTLLNSLITLVTATNPGYTANLPGSLIEDISSTDVGALALIDAARVDLINAITPYGANQFILNQLGQIYGVQQGQGSNTSVYVTFSGSPGFVINAGFVVSDGSYQYVVQDSGIIGAGSPTGQSAALYCLANTAGSWAVPSGTVTQLVTSVPLGVTLSCTNVSAGLPGATAQTVESYRAQVLQSGLSTCQGTPAFVKAALQNVAGVQPRLISVRNPGTNQWEIIVGGGDPYQVANAIFQSIPDVSMLVGSATTARNITVSVNDYPDTYSIIFVNPPVQTVTVDITWNTISPNIISPNAVVALAQPAIVDYINSIYVGQPINTYELQDAFQNAVSSIIDPSLISKINYAVYINGTLTPPVSGTLLIYGDNESYFSTNASLVSIVQG